MSKPKLAFESETPGFSKSFLTVLARTGLPTGGGRGEEGPEF